MILSHRIAAYLSTFCVLFVSGVDVSHAGMIGMLIKPTMAAIPIVLAIDFFRRTGNFRNQSVNRIGIYLIFSFILFSGFSLVWSINVSATVTAIIAWMYTLSACYILVGLGLPSAATIIVITFGWLCAISLGLSFTWSEAFVVNQGVLRFQGIFYGPHALAQPAAVCMAIIASGVLLIRRSALVLLALIIGACLLLTFSRQAIAVAVIGAVIALLLKVRKNSHVVIVAFMTGLLSIALLFYYVTGVDVAEIASRGEGDDIASFTGRTYIWDAALELINQRPLFGHGFGAGGVALQDYYSGRFGWRTFSAHNAFLQVLLDIGWIGLILILGILGYWLVRCITIMPIFSAPVFACILLLSLVERGFYSPGGFIPMVFMLTLIAGPSYLARRW